MDYRAGLSEEELAPKVPRSCRPERQVATPTATTGKVPVVSKLLDETATGEEPSILRALGHTTSEALNPSAGVTSDTSRMGTNPVSSWVCEAVRSKKLVMLVYAGSRRHVRPVLHGHTADGLELLLGYEDNDLVGARWKTFRVDRMQALSILYDLPLLVRVDDSHLGRPNGFTTVCCAARGLVCGAS